jgi:hypothetical protein
MDRRKFVSLGAASVCMMPLLGSAAFLSDKYDVPMVKPQWVIDLIKLNDIDVKNISAYKITDTAKKYYGGYMSEVEIPNPHSTCAFINRACGAIASAESSYYQSTDLLKDINLALKALLKMQHADGTIDLMDTNFHSTPDTAFMVKRLVQSYNLLQQSGTKGTAEVLVPFEQFLKQAGEALIIGGIHTPNHRWVVSAALTKLNEKWPDKRYVNRVNDWLAEHIDLDPDGQYTEKSTYGYSAVVDRVLITVSKGLHKPEILDAVRKNILMMRYYLHPNGEVVTEASNRQDKGQIGTMENYYYACRYMSLLDNDGEMAAMCRLIESTSFRKLTDTLNYYLEDPSLWKELPGSKALPVSYVKSFPYSGLVRIRRNEWDTTILSNNPGWLTFHKGNAVLQGMRVAASFFGKGQFQSDTIKETGNTWILSKKLDGPYFQPFPKDKIPADGDMAKMPKSGRKQSEVQYLETTVTIAEANNGMSITIEMGGTDNVPVSMELIFRRGGKFSGVQQHPAKTDAWLFSEKEGSYSVGEHTIHFGPGKLEHKNVQLRGALPAMDAPTVYLTGFTPFKHTIQLT